MPKKKPTTPPDQANVAVVPLFYTTAQVAELFCTTENTVRYWRTNDLMTGPLAVLVGRRVLYPRAAIEKLAAQLIRDAAAGD